MSFFCHYCGQNRPDEQLTKEHVLPKALGGNVEPKNPFALDVCRRCNIACGRHVDGPFIRSWRTQMDRFANARRYIDLEQNPVIPLLYLGENHDIQWEEKICDYWQGPAGDHVFHFHERYLNTESVRPEVGRPLNAKPQEIDAGFILVFLVATNPPWIRCAIKSVMEQIDDAPIYVVNLKNQPQGNARFGEIPASLTPLIEQLKQADLNNQIVIQIDAGERFLAKLAVGFGSLFLDSSFKTSEDVTKLRNYLWAKSAEDRQALKMYGTGFFSNLFHCQPGNNLNDLIGWKPGHVILLQAFDQQVLTLSVMFYGSQSATVRVSSNPDHWKNLGEANAPNGTVFLVAPGFRTFVGPVPLSRYIAARGELKVGKVIPVVGSFLQQVEEHPPPPSFEAESTIGPAALSLAKSPSKTRS